MKNKNNDHLGKYISLLNRQGAAFLTKKYSKLGIGAGQYMFMIHLYRNDGISQEQLTEILNIDKGTTAKAIRKLEEVNLVTRVKDVSDKRVNKIYLTEQSLNIKKEFFEILDIWESKLVSGLTDDEIELALNVLKKLSKNAITKEND